MTDPINTIDTGILHFKDAADRQARINAALARVKAMPGLASTPVSPSDPDIVLVACRNEISHLTTLLEAGQSITSSHVAELKRLREIIDYSIKWLASLGEYTMVGNRSQLKDLVDATVEAFQGGGVGEMVRLRQALIDVAAAVGGSASADSSNAFLRLIPGEVKLVVERLRASRPTSAVLDLCEAKLAEALRVEESNRKYCADISLMQTKIDTANRKVEECLDMIQRLRGSHGTIKAAEELDLEARDLINRMKGG